MKLKELPLPVQKGIKQEKKILDKLVTWLSRSTEENVFAFQFPESGRKAALDRHFVGDLVITVGKKTIFIDCTSVYERSDSPNSYRLRTSNKNIRFLREYCERINQARKDFLEAEKDTEDEVKKLQIFETRISSTCSYLDETLDIENGPWWDSEEFRAFLAFEWANRVCIIPIEEYTLSQVLEKSDPGVFEAVKFSFVPPTFSAHVIYGSYYGLGQLFIDSWHEMFGNLIEITEKKLRNNAKTNEPIISPLKKWADEQIETRGAWSLHDQ